ncbi:MAG TPA: glycosyltransferase family 2 protein [Actinomycetota bacterium]|nr:glycosyltransferase family 2 protein [Actinomycetota bacterium]
MAEAEELDVSVVLPVFNEKGHIRAEIERIQAALDSSHYSYEIIVVDDGSTDGSLEEVRSIEGIRLIELGRNRGTGFARRVGTRSALGEVVVWTDVDMTYPNTEIPALVKELEGCDQIVGARTSEQGTARLLRVPTKWFIRRLAEYLVEEPIPDLNSGFRAFRKVIAAQFLHLLPHGFSCVSTMTMCFLTNGYSIKYVPIEYAPRAGESKFHWWKDTKRYLTQVIRMVLTFNPLRVFLPVGTLMILVAFTKLGYDLITKDLYVTTNTLLMIFAAFQVLVIGLLADLIVRVSRPRDNIDPASF